MYRIYKGTITNREFIERNVYYTVSVIGENRRLIAQNIAHGYQTDPNSVAGIYEIGTGVYLAGQETNIGTIVDGVILAAVKPKSRELVKVKSELDDIYELLDEGQEVANCSELTPGDIYFRKEKGVFKFAYDGFYKILSKPGLGITINPKNNKLTISANNLEINQANFAQLTSEVFEESGETNLHFHFSSDTTGQNPEGSIITLDLGKFNNTNERVKFMVINSLDPTNDIIKFKCVINKDGSIEIFSKKFNLKIGKNNEDVINASLNIDEDGNVRFDTETFLLGRDTPNQPMIRGKEFAKNYNTLIDLLKCVLPNYALQAKAELLKIYEDISPELSKTNKID